jgi:uncharacterized protein (TIGR02996 family)
MDRASFLGAIADCPEDDSPRLIYADWLEERGDPLGRFIRIQCALERLQADDRRRPALEGEEREILSEYEEEWTADLRGAAEAWQFRRGLVEGIEASGELFLECAGGWFDDNPIREVCLRIHPTLMPAFAARPELVRVESLAFRGQFLRDRQLRELLASKHLRRLSHLNLAGQGIEAAGVRALLESDLMPRLRSLDLGKNRAIGDQAARLLAAASSAAELRVLKLGETNLTARGVGDLFGSTTLVGLRELDVSAQRTRDLTGFTASIARSPMISRLSRLDLGDHALSSADLEILLTVLARPGFERLNLSGCRLNEQAALTLCSMPFDGLRGLDLNRNQIGSEGLQALARTAALKNLTELRLAWNNVQDSGVKSIDQFQHLSKLTVLDLSNNHIGGPGIRAVATSPVFSNLRELDLSDNYVNMASVEALVNGQHLSRLRKLRLNDNRLDEARVRNVATAANPLLQVEVNQTRAEAMTATATALLGYGSRG